MTKLRIGILGCGAVARHAHLPAWLHCSDTEIAAVCDCAEEPATALATRVQGSCRMFSDERKFLESGLIDVVDICTPGPLHGAQVRTALEAGHHVLVEKPPVASVAEARCLIELADSHRLKLGAVFNYRYRDLVADLRAVVASGVAGTVAKAQVIQHGPFVFADARWLWDEKKTKYLLWEYGIHIIDLLVYLFGPDAAVLRVTPYVNNAVGHTTELDILLQFGTQTTVNVQLSADTTRHSSALTQINLFGSGSDVFVRWFPPTIRVVAGVANPLEVLWTEAKAFGSLAKKLATGEFIRHRNISHYRLIADYRAWVSGDGEFPLSFESILPTIALLERIQGHVPSYCG
ncbi:MAG: Gfo/Idh/MocA family oxidoreductase [Bryobacteraceae bacterium]